MFWKSVKTFKLQSLSLITKLMLFYSLSTIGLLSAITLFLYPTYVKIMAGLRVTKPSDISIECFGKIIISLLIASLISIVFGHLIARNGLRRIREFEDTMERITANSLNERIKLNEWPKELKSLANKFNTMLNRIQTSFSQLSKFSSDIAHELRTPVNNLIGITEVTLSHEKTQVEYQEVLTKSMKEYQHLSKLIENLLFLARSDHGQLAIKKENINLNFEIVNLCDYYQAMADEKQIELFCTGNAIISADVILFKRAISNLLSNSLKYTAFGKIHINIQKNKRLVLITVSDTGIGIPDKDIDRIFDRFYRVDQSRSLSSGGIGLGLAIVKSIMDLHKGKILINSQVDAGTIVTLYFPIS